MTFILETVVPVFAVVLLGYLLAGRRGLHVGTLTDLAILVTAPCFIFSSLAASHLGAGAVLELVGGALWTALILAAVTAWLVRGRNLRGMVIGVAMWNAGNLALPTCRLAFGDEGLAAATVVFVTIATLHGTLAVAIAKGRGGHFEVFRLPLLYASALGILVAAFDLDVPRILAEPIEMVGQMAIPLMLICLGLQLRTLRIHSLQQAVVLAALRIVGGVLLMLAFVTLFDVQGVHRKVLLVNSVMPPAVINYLIAKRYDANPDLVASGIVLTTLLSVGTIPLMLWFLA